jgi:hypothetical protein
MAEMYIEREEIVKGDWEQRQWRKDSEYDSHEKT